MSDLAQRLLETWCGHSGMQDRHLINPDGPEAATTLAAKDAEIARLRDDLKQAERGFNACNILLENLTGVPSAMIETFEERARRATGADHD